jgi:hypothetical protein
MQQVVTGQALGRPGWSIASRLGPKSPLAKVVANFVRNGLPAREMENNIISMEIQVATFASSSEATLFWGDDANSSGSFYEELGLPIS